VDVTVKIAANALRTAADLLRRFRTERNRRLREPAARQRCAGAAMSLHVTASGDLSSQSGLLAKEFRTYLESRQGNCGRSAGGGAAERPARAG
jgi:hypothetical protein